MTLPTIHDSNDACSPTAALLTSPASLMGLQNKNICSSLRNLRSPVVPQLEDGLEQLYRAGGFTKGTQQIGQGAEDALAVLFQQKLEEQNLLEKILMTKRFVNDLGNSNPVPSPTVPQDLLAWAYRLGQLSSSRSSSIPQSLNSPTTGLLPPPSSPPCPSSPLQRASFRSETSSVRKASGKNFTFPQKLHECLSDLEKQEFGVDIACFLPNGRAFIIRRPLDFVNHIMPKYFERMSHFSSFQRQLNLYDFQRITEGPDAGAYYHELFLRGQPLLCTWMKRNKIKGKATKSTQQSKKNCPDQTVP